MHERFHRVVDQFTGRCPIPHSRHHGVCGRRPFVACSGGTCLDLDDGVDLRGHGPPQLLTQSNQRLRGGLYCRSDAGRRITVPPEELVRGLPADALPRRGQPIELPRLDGQRILRRPHRSLQRQAPPLQRSQIHPVLGAVPVVDL